MSISDDAVEAAWDRALGSMVYDDGTPVELMRNNNPYRPAP